jgi:hypothetical protein
MGLSFKHALRMIEPTTKYPVHVIFRTKHIRLVSTNKVVFVSVTVNCGEFKFRLFILLAK